MERPDIAALSAEPAPERSPFLPAPATARVIEVGDVTAGIAVPDGHGVRFFSASRHFDSLDGAVFRSAESAARAARERARLPDRAATPRSPRPIAV